MQDSLFFVCVHHSTEKLHPFKYARYIIIRSLGVSGMWSCTRLIMWWNTTRCISVLFEIWSRHMSSVCLYEHLSWQRSCRGIHCDSLLITEGKNSSRSTTPSHLFVLQHDTLCYCLLSFHLFYKQVISSFRVICRNVPTFQPNFTAE